MGWQNFGGARSKFVGETLVDQGSILSFPTLTSAMPSFKENSEMKKTKRNGARI